MVCAVLGKYTFLKTNNLQNVKQKNNMATVRRRLFEWIRFEAHEQKLAYEIWWAG